MIDCADAVKQLWEYLDRALSEEDRARVEEHLDFCRKCCGELEFAREIQAFLATKGAEEVPPEVKARLEATLDAMLVEPSEG